MPEVPRVCSGCGKACENGCTMMSRNRKAGGATQTQNDQKGDRGRRADRGKASDHAAKEPEEKKPTTAEEAELESYKQKVPNNVQYTQHG